MHVPVFSFEELILRPAMFTSGCVIINISDQSHSNKFIRTSRLISTNDYFKFFFFYSCTNTAALIIRLLFAKSLMISDITGSI